MLAYALATPASDPVVGGRVSAAVRATASCAPPATDFPSNAVIPIYSISKPLTAICVLRLVERGALPLARLLDQRG